MAKLPITDHEQQAQTLANELTHPDQELTLDDLESDMSTIFELFGEISLKLPEATHEEVDAIIDRAFEIARDNTN